MMVLSLCQKHCPNSIPFLIGSRLGDGADGEILSLPNDQSKVIKLGVLFDSFESNLTSDYDLIKSNIDWLIRNQPSCYAKVYEQGYLGNFTRKTAHLGGKQDFILYYYTMEKLYNLSNNEKEAFRIYISNIYNKNASEILKNLSRIPNLNTKKMLEFIDGIKSSPMIHLDLHPLNIMKDNLGIFKLIDFERIRIGEKYVKES